jgi:hypothetical protein
MIRDPEIAFIVYFALATAIAVSAAIFFTSLIKRSDVNITLESPAPLIQPWSDDDVYEYTDPKTSQRYLIFRVNTHITAVRAEPIK